MAGLERTLEVVSEIDRITRWHEQYKEGSRTPKLPSAEELQKNLFGIIQNYAAVDSRVAESVARIHTALVQRNDTAFWPYVGNALVLTEQSQSGKSNEIAFQDTVRYLLAKGDYTPVRTESYREGSFHFYTDDKGTKVAAISEKGCIFYVATLKSEFHLDALVDDFSNLKEGRNKALREKEWLFQSPPFWLLGGLCGVMLGSFAGLMVGLSYSSPKFTDNEGLASLGIIAAGGVAGAYSAQYIRRKIFNVTYARKLKKETPKFPHSKLTKGLDAILDAFPLTKTAIVEH